MAATYYSRNLHAYDWREIARRVDAVIELLREDATREDADAQGAYADRPEDDTIRGAVYLGRTYRDAPSGSFYAPWSAVPDSVRDADARWYDALDRAALKFGLHIESGEGDPTDTYAVKYTYAD